jgi:hypothetical protein
MAERWCKLYPNALTDPLWLAVADDAGTSPGLVGATFVELLTWTTEHAPDTGSITGFDPRVWAAWLRIAPEAVERIIASLRKFGRLAGDTIANWAKRQGSAAVGMIAANVNKIARKVSTPRTRKHRERERQGELLLPIAGTPASVPEGVPAFPERVPDVPDAKTQAISASCAAAEKEKEREPDSSLVNHAKNEQGVSQRCALSARPSPAEVRAKRANLIKTLGRWVRCAGVLDKDEQIHRLLMLSRAETALDRWDERDAEDKRAFDFLDKRARARPLTRDMVLACEQAERDEARRRMAGGWGNAAA